MSNPTQIPSGSFLNSINLMEFHCPSSVSVISQLAFRGCVSLTKFVLLEDSMLNRIEKLAFSDCSLRDFAIPKYLSAGECDFRGIVTLGENYSNKYFVEAGITTVVSL